MIESKERPPVRAMDPVTELCPNGPDFTDEGSSGGETSVRTKPDIHVESFPHSTSGLDWLDEIGL
jgi:hypothetical protein